MQIFLDIIDYLKYEEDCLPIQAAHYGLDYIRSMISKNDEFELFKIFYKSTFENILYRFLEKKNVEMDKNLEFQQSVIKSLCIFGHENCLMFSRRFFEEWMKGDLSLPTGLEGAVLQTVVENGNDKDWYDIYEKALETNSYGEKIVILSALAHSRNPKLIQM